MTGVASPTERADKRLPATVAALRKSGYMVITPEDIQAGWRVLTPEQAEAIPKAMDALLQAIRWIGGWERPMKRRPAVLKLLRDARDEVLALAGVPDKDGGGNITCEECGAVVAWEGERPEDCLKCGMPVGSDT